MFNKKIKYLITIWFSLLTFSANALTQDEAKIKSTIHGFSTLADHGAYEYLGRLFSPNIIVDYTSLWGGEATTITNVDLMKQWKGFLPGFDTTYHELKDLKLDIQEDNAIVLVDFSASHWLGENGFWAVSGSYEFKLNKNEDAWYINSIKLIYKNESGNRDILSKAPSLSLDNQKKRDSKLLKL